MNWTVLVALYVSDSLKRTKSQPRVRVICFDNLIPKSHSLKESGHTVCFWFIVKNQSHSFQESISLPSPTFSKDPNCQHTAHIFDLFLLSYIIYGHTSSHILDSDIRSSTDASDSLKMSLKWPRGQFYPSHFPFKRTSSCVPRFHPRYLIQIGLFKNSTAHIRSIRWSFTLSLSDIKL